MKNFLIAVFLCITISGLVAQSGFKQIEYWFDDDLQEMKHQVVDFSGTTYVWNTQLDTDGLTHGLHQLTVRAKSLDNKYSNVASYFFLKIVTHELESLQGVEYWFNHDLENRMFYAQTQNEFSFDVSTNELKEGLNLIHYRLRSINGTYSQVSSSFFFKEKHNNLASKVDAYEYWFDGEDANKTKIVLSEAVAPFQLIKEIDVPVLELGAHYFHIRFRSTDGYWTSVSSSMFEVNQCSLTKAAFPQGETELCSDEEMSVYTTRKSKRASSYLWKIIPEEAANLDTQDTIVYVNWNSEFKGMAKIWVHAQNACGVGEASDTLEIERIALPEKPIVSEHNSYVFCEGDSVVLVAPDAYLYRWSDLSQNDTLIVKSSGDYFVSVFNEKGCSRNSDTIVVQVHEKPHRPGVLAYGTTEFCKGDSVEIGLNNEIKVDYTFEWSNGADTESIWAKETGAYSLRYISEFGCIGSWSYPVEIEVYDYPEKPLITVEGNELSSTEAFAYQWYKSMMPIAGLVPVDGEVQQTFRPESDGTYAVEVSNEHDCKLMSDEIEFMLSSSGLFEKIELSVYPNPSHGKMHLNMSQVIDELHVYDLQGRIVYSSQPKKHNVQLDLKIQKGFYILKLYSGNQQFTQRIVVE